MHPTLNEVPAASDKAIALLTVLLTTCTQGRWGRNIAPASRYPIVYAGRCTHVVEMITRSVPASEAEANTDLVVTARNELPGILARLAAVEAIVATLHKTADGVPIVFGMTAWFFDEEAQYPHDGTWDSNGDFVETIVNAIYAKNFDSYAGEVTVGVAADWEGGNGEVWSTRAAAIASMPPAMTDEEFKALAARVDAGEGGGNANLTD